MSEEKEILVTKTNSSLDKYIVEKDTRFDVVNSEQIIKRLQEENKRLQMLSCANCGEKYLSPDGAELYEKNIQLQKENEKLKNINNDLIEEIASGNIDIAILQKENEELKKLKCKFKEYCTCDIEKYRSVLEEIRGFISPTYFDCKNCKELKKPFTQQNCNGFRYETILNRIDEVLK